MPVGCECCGDEGQHRLPANSITRNTAANPIWQMIHERSGEFVSAFFSRQTGRRSLLATRVQHGPVKIGEVFEITNEIESLDRPHNLKVVGVRRQNRQGVCGASPLR
jgi:hypothetical protein